MRRPVYVVFIVDTSLSMGDDFVLDRDEESFPKMEELNCGLEDALNALRRFEEGNASHTVYFQIIELNRYGRALFPDFVPLSPPSEPICFKAKGVTCLENSLATLKTFLEPRHMADGRCSVSVILISDGYPTDAEGYVVDEPTYKNVIRDFKMNLEDRGVQANVDLYAIGVGPDARQEMLSFFADEGRCYMVENVQLLARTLVFVVGKSMVSMTTRGKSTPQIRDQETVKCLVDVRTATRRIAETGCFGAVCLACLRICPFSAIEQRNGLVMIRPDRCVGCGYCDSVCSAAAIGCISDPPESIEGV